MVRGPGGDDREPRSLGELHRSVAVPRLPTFWRRLFAFAGPAYLVSVGYMDPGNWATDIAAGARLGYGLLWILLLSSMTALLLQTLSARLGIASGMDLAQACRAMFPGRLAIVLWLLAEVAIVACDLAEVLGTAIGLQLLFGLPLLFGVALTTLDTFVLLFLQSRGIRLMEAFVVVLIVTVGVCLGIEVFLARPDLDQVILGFVPSLAGDQALYLAIGILGATVMPHNLYLHSALVQSRVIAQTPAGIRSGVRFNSIDSVVALSGAFFVNAALLVMAAATFFKAGATDVVEIQEAHRLLEPLLGSRIAPLAFAVALIAAGQSSTITGTLAGQIVMEGFVRVRLRPLARRLVTRGLAIVPAALTILVFGEQATGDLLVLSQVVLSLQLSFAVIPLVHLVSDRRFMGQYRVSRLIASASWLAAAAIAGLNSSLVYQALSGWLEGPAKGAVWPWLTVVPLTVGLAGLLIYVTVVPAWQRRRKKVVPSYLGVHGKADMPAVHPAEPPRLIATAVDFTGADPAVLSHAVMLARAAGSRILLLHVVESGAARLLGAELADSEAHADQARLELYAAELQELGVQTTYDLGFGDPVEALARHMLEHKPQLLVLGAHGHQVMGDLVYGTTVDKLRHRIRTPILVVPAAPAEPG